MIFRNSRINLDSDEVAFQVSYSHIDVKRWLIQYVAKLQNCGIIDNETIMDCTSEMEANLRHWLELGPLKGFSNKHAEKLSRWAINAAVRKKYLSPSATNPTTFIFAESIIKKASE